MGEVYHGSSQSGISKLEPKKSTHGTFVYATPYKELAVIFSGRCGDDLTYTLYRESKNEPWKLAKEDTNKCEEILYNCCNIILNINNLLKPYFVETTKRVETYLNASINEWNYKKLNCVNLSKEINPLFIRYDKSLIEEERKLLNK